MPAGCASAQVDTPLPAWARGGFHPSDRPIPHVLGDRQRIVAVLWSWPRALFAPPLRSRRNKILWVARSTPQVGGDLRISAQRLAGTRPVGAPISRVVVGGPGPSIIDVPSAGCWQFTLRWSGETDTLDLYYYSHR